MTSKEISTINKLPSMIKSETEIGAKQGRRYGLIKAVNTLLVYDEFCDQLESLIELYITKNFNDTEVN